MNCQNGQAAGNSWIDETTYAKVLKLAGWRCVEPGPRNTVDSTEREGTCPAAATGWEDREAVKRFKALDRFPLIWYFPIDDRH